MGLLLKKRFEPTNLAGCVLWLRADSLIGDGLADAAAVATWRDLSGQGKDVSQSTGSAKPTLQTGELVGRPVVRGDGGDKLVSSSGYSLTALTAFVVVTNSATATDHIIGEWKTTGNQREWRIWVDTAGSYRASASSNGTATTTVGSTSITNPAILATKHTGSALTLYKNGTDVGNGAATLFDGTAALSIADGEDFSQGYPGDIAEAVIYNRALEDIDRKRVERYLGARYGISVA